MMPEGLDPQTEMALADFIEYYTEACPDEYFPENLDKVMDVLKGIRRKVTIRCGRTVIVVEKVGRKLEVKKKSVVM